MNQISLLTNQLYGQLKKDIQSSNTIYILSSFIMRSGIDLIYADLQDALKRNADIKVLTGDYLYVTQPQALLKLLSLQQSGYNLEIRLWQSKGIAFHPKSFLFKTKYDGAFIVGSSNLSRSALTSGVEWNLRINQQIARKTFDKAMKQFIALFYAAETMEINLETIKKYDDAYHEFHRVNQNLLHRWTAQEEIEMTLPVIVENRDTNAIESPEVYDIDIKPRLAQLEALTALNNTVEEDYNKAMVVMATGLGKTYLAAFFARNYPKVLFIAHREEIIKQAKTSFEKVLNKTGGLYYGLAKETNHDLIFASIYTLSIQEHLHQFSSDEFDLIVIDEFHHAAAKSYQKVIDYFQPQFLLGLTATPERTDGKDVFAICDGNVAYEITFIEAIQKGWLTPFQYYGIKDDIDYSNIRWLGTKYDEQELLIEQLNTKRAAHIFNNWLQYKQTRTLAFCSSIEQADFLANYFKEQGIHAISLTSKTVNLSRESAIEQLTTKAVEIIFTVDLFNEGVDIPSVDTILFARPTESLVVFTQQIGRGLRKFADKNHCVIIDLIGNYRHADTKLQVFNSPLESKNTSIIPKVPEACSIELEIAVINLLKELRAKRSPRRERIIADFTSVKERLGRRPTYREVHLYGNGNSKEYRQAFGGYFAFLAENNELTEHENNVYNTYYQWLNKLEKEQMTKSYKMVVLECLLEKGPDSWYKPITPQEVAPYFHHFYMAKNYRKKIDFSTNNTKKLWEYDKDKVARLVASMPMNKWVDKENLISFDDGIFSINFEISKEDEDILHMMTRQICEYKMQTYFERKGYKK